MSNKPYVSHWRGPKAELNNVPIQDGQILFCTDTGEMFIDIGTDNRKKVTGDASSFLGVVFGDDEILNIINSKIIYETDNTAILEIGVNIGDFFRIGEDFTVNEQNEDLFVLKINNKDNQNEDAHGGDILIVINKIKPEKSDSKKWELVFDVLHVDSEWDHVHPYIPEGNVTINEKNNPEQKTTNAYTYIKSIGSAPTFSGEYIPGEEGESGSLKLSWEAGIEVETDIIPAITYIEEVKLENLTATFTGVNKNTEAPIANPGEPIEEGGDE